MKKSLLILLLLTASLLADKKPRHNVTVEDTMPPTGLKTEVGNYLIIEASRMVTSPKRGSAPVTT